MKKRIWVILLGTSLLSCQGRDYSVRRDQSLEGLFERTKDTLADLVLDVERPEDRPRESRRGIGFFISPRGRILTAAHQVPTTHSVVALFTSEQGASFSVATTIVRRNKELDLAVLEPDRPIPSVRYLLLDLDTPVAPGQAVAALTQIWHVEGPPAAGYFAPTILPATVISVFHGGFFGIDVYAFSGISGSPVIDSTSGKAIGVCVRRDQEFETFERKTIPYPLPDGTTASLPVPYLVVNYGIVRSLSAAREFLANLE